MNLRRIILGAGGLLVVIATILIFILRPQVEGSSPDQIEGGVSRFTSIEITFSREMQTDSVEQRLEISPMVGGDFSWVGNTLQFEPSEGWPAGAEVVVKLLQGARSQLGLPLSEEYSWVFDVSPVQLAYLWPAEGNANIFLIDLENSLTIQLTEMGGVISYTVSPDGMLVYFFARNSQGGTDLFLVDRFIGEADRVLSCQRALCSDPAISADGEWLSYQRGEAEIWVLPLTGGGEEEQVSGTDQTASSPTWSTNGLLSYYDSLSQKFVVLDDARGETIISWDNQAGELGAWTAAGNGFAAPDFFEYETDLLRGPTGEESNQEVDPAELEPVVVAGSHLLLYSLDNGLIIDLTEEDLAEDYSPAYSPDGTLLAFTRRYLDEVRWTPGRQVWLMPAGGGGSGQRRQVTDAPDFEYSALTWHPDSTHIAAVRFNVTLLTGSPEIWLLDLKGGATRLVIRGYDPQWVP
jgi:Tol biopolymer transport system component